jgi:hypothetical protein
MSTTGTETNVENYIGEINKGKGVLVKVRLNTFKGKTYIDQRIFMGDKIPTTKGVSLEVKHIAELINLLEKAEQEVNKHGLS